VETFRGRGTLGARPCQQEADAASQGRQRPGFRRVTGVHQRHVTRFRRAIPRLPEQQIGGTLPPPVT
jgi:hypothetical protein